MIQDEDGTGEEAENSLAHTTTVYPVNHNENNTFLGNINWGTFADC